MAILFQVSPWGASQSINIWRIPKRMQSLFVEFPVLWYAQRGAWCAGSNKLMRDGNGQLKVYESTSLECYCASCQWLWNCLTVTGVKAPEAQSFAVIIR